MGVVLIDIDQVLAMYRGEDCRPGCRIFRTFRHRPRGIERMRDYRVRLIAITHRGAGQARCLLEAVGLDQWVDGVICADDLFVESLQQVFQRRRFHGLSKLVAGTLLVRRFGSYDPARSVMIDDRIVNLLGMVRSAVVRYGILVPSIVVDDHHRVRSFDLEKILAVALDVVLLGEIASSHLGLGAVEAREVPEGGLAATEGPESKWMAVAPEDFRLPRVPSIIRPTALEPARPQEEFSTAVCLSPEPWGPLSLLRAARGASSRFAGRLGLR